MNATRKQLTTQFNRAVALGWLPFFVEAVKAHTAGFFDAADLMGIASRETNLESIWLKKAGDNGHGFGLMQADVRSFPEWIKSGKWRDAREGILMGALVLMKKLADVRACIGRRCEVKSSKTGEISTFIGKRVEGAELQQVSIASYNAGRWGHYAVSKGRSADAFTTGKDYSGDVIERAAFFRPLVEKWMAENGLLSNKQTEPDQQLPAEPQPQTGLQSNNDPVVLNPTEPVKEDSFLASAVDRNVSPDELKTAARTAAPRILVRFARPFAILYAMLEAGNVYAWLGVAVGVIGLGLLIYLHRADLKKVFEKIKAKILQ